MLKKLLEADQLGLRLEWVGGLPLWEAQPTYRHQKAVDRIRQSIRPKEGFSCPCIHFAVAPSPSRDPKLLQASHPLRLHKLQKALQHPAREKGTPVDEARVDLDQPGS